MSPPRLTNRPTKKDTLAEKAEKRSQRLSLGRRLAVFSPDWWVGTGELLGLLCLLSLNFVLLFPLFGQEDQTNVFSAPLIPVLANLSKFLIEYRMAIRFWLIILVLFLPISFYFFIREITSRRLAAFVAAVIISLPIGFFLPLRMEVALLTEDGGQVASLTLVILTCLFLHRFLRTGSFKMALASSLMTMVVGLTSPLGLFILFCFAMAITGSEILLGRGRLKIMRFLVILVLAAGFSAFWYNPKYIFLIVSSDQGIILRQTLANLFPLSFFIAPLLGTLGFLLFENRPNLEPLSMALFLTIGFGALALGAGSELSVPSRFMPVFGISLAFLAGVALTSLSDFIRKSPRLDKYRFVSQYRHLFTSALALAFIVFLLIVITSRGREFIAMEKEQVLGVSTMDKTGIWEIREQSEGWANILGGGISFFTGGMVVYLRRRLNNKNVV